MTSPTLAKDYGGHIAEHTVTLKKILNFISLMFFAFVIFGGTTVVGAHKNELLLTGAAVSVFAFLAADLKFKFFNLITLLWIYVLIFMFSSTLLGYDFSSTVKYFLIYISSFIAMLSGFTKEEYKLFIKICEIFALVFALSIIVGVFIPSLYTRTLAFIFNSPDRVNLIVRTNRVGIYSGLSGEMGEASYVSCILIAIQLCRIFSNRKASKRNVVFLIIGIAALMLTGKRTMLIIPLICILGFVFVNNIKGKYLKLFVFGTAAIGGVLLASMIFPPLAVTIDRIFNSSSDSALSGRNYLWNLCQDMFRHNPFFGRGFGSFNHFANNDIDVIYNVIKRQSFSSWYFEAHSMYYQFFGELGIFGAVPAFFAIGYTLIKTFRLRKYLADMDSTEKFIYHFSLFFQIWFCVYGLTGNVGYYAQDTIIYFISVGICLYFINKYHLTRFSFNKMNRTA